MPTSSTPTRSTPTSSTQPSVCGIFRLGGSQVAVPIEVLREVVPAPASLDALPAAVPGLIGATTLREQVVAVADLRLVLGIESPRGSDQVVVVVQTADGVIGLLADAVLGVDVVPHEALRQVTDAAGRLFSHLFRAQDGGCVVSVLDVGRLGALGLPLVRATRRDGAAVLGAGGDGGGDAGGGAGGDGGGSRSLLLVRCGEVGLGIDIARVHATLPHLPVHDSPLAHGACRGVVRPDGSDLAVVDTLTLLGLGVTTGDALSSVALRMPQGRVALLTSLVVDIVDVATEHVLPLVPGAVRCPDRFTGVAVVPGQGDFLVLDPDWLDTDEDLAALARVQAEAAESTAPQQDPTSADDDRRRAPLGEALLAYDAGTVLVSPVTQVQEVLPLPSRLTSGNHLDPAFRGFFTHRGAVIPLVCLPSLLGHPGEAAGSSACVLVVRTAAGPVGLIARRLVAIERSVWAPEHEEQQGASVDRLAAALADRLVVRTTVIGTADSEHLRSRLDLVTVAAALQDRLGCVLPRPRTAVEDGPFGAAVDPVPGDLAVPAG